MLACRQAVPLCVCELFLVMCLWAIFSEFLRSPSVGPTVGEIESVEQLVGLTRSPAVEMTKRVELWIYECAYCVKVDSHRLKMGTVRIGGNQQFTHNFKLV